MKSRAARLALLVLFMVALAVTAFLFRTSESAARTQSEAALNFSDDARTVARGVMEIRGAQRAYVAAGQPGDQWPGKVTDGVATVRNALTTLRAAAASRQAQTEIDSATAALQDFVQTDGRARNYVRSNQNLLASDLIFTSGMELTEPVLAALERARSAELQARSSAEATFERRQMFALAAAAAAAVLVVLLLFPRVDVELGPTLVSTHAPAFHRTLPTASDSVDLMNPDPDSWSTATRVKVASATEAPPPATVSSSEPAEFTATPLEPAAVPIAESVSAPTAPAPPPIDLRGIAALCTQLSRVEDTLALPPLLERAASLLDAAGIVLWIADPDCRELSPILAQGYPHQLVARLGSIPRDAQNATAAAFRTSLLQTVDADDASNGAIAAPLVTSGGCVGVMAAEIRGAGEKQEAKLAAAMIVAAQLASLVGPPASRSVATVEAVR
jgi:cbb3-type cytochrome oxidase subunit 3